MSSNIFNSRRFLLLCRQHFVHNNKLLGFSAGAYVGVVFILLSFVQATENFLPHDLDNFRGFLIGFVIVFGLLYVGYSFPAFRSKESTMNYLLVPASLIEKFVFELVTRIGLMLLALPLLFWITFNLQGYFFTLFTEFSFDPIGIQQLVTVEMPNGIDSVGWFIVMITGLALLLFVVPFTGAAIFSKQPLVKTLFSVAVIVIFYSTVIYLVAEPLGLNQYHRDPEEGMWLLPTNEHTAFRFFGVVVIIANAVMLFVAYRKLKEREV
ncbi:hypothetical protein RT717_11135 [Imperialibacter roseus]|uniref:ABC transporter permease n=1 Tax=Imperialibacter roseus TaxID=1324217 RepID=A0ABZ0IZ09_9BACT|nr:hypothetical protein [Imperialibacter roseus]WOK09190.1 hypothetical protein RT717_11135 [Imperialibacter roseus]